MLVLEPVVHRRRARLLPGVLPRRRAGGARHRRGLGAGQPLPLGARGAAGHALLASGPGQAKLVRCARGRDPRRGGRHPARLAHLRRAGRASSSTTSTRRQVYVPVGFAHGFVVLSDVADVVYRCSAYYDGAEGARHRLGRPRGRHRVARRAGEIVSARDADGAPRSPRSPTSCPSLPGLTAAARPAAPDDELAEAQVGVGAGVPGVALGRPRGRARAERSARRRGRRSARRAPRPARARRRPGGSWRRRRRPPPGWARGRSPAAPPRRPCPPRSPGGCRRPRSARTSRRSGAPARGSRRRRRSPGGSRPGRPPPADRRCSRRRRARRPPPPGASRAPSRRCASISRWALFSGTSRPDEQVKRPGSTPSRRHQPASPGSGTSAP